MAYGLKASSCDPLIHELLHRPRTFGTTNLQLQVLSILHEYKSLIILKGFWNNDQMIQKI